MNEARQHAGICNLKDKYVFASGPSVSVERYDIASDSWQMMPSMNEKRNCHASCALGDQIYVICGSYGQH